MSYWESSVDWTLTGFVQFFPQSVVGNPIIWFHLPSCTSTFQSLRLEKSLIYEYRPSKT